MLARTKRVRGRRRGKIRYIHTTYGGRRNHSKPIACLAWNLLLMLYILIPLPHEQQSILHLEACCCVFSYNLFTSYLNKLASPHGNPTISNLIIAEVTGSAERYPSRSESASYSPTYGQWRLGTMAQLCTPSWSRMKNLSVTCRSSGGIYSR